jgi:deoxyribose-phosphate aldolase
LKPNVTTSDLNKLCEDAKKYELHSVVVYPLYVDHCKYLLHGSGVVVCAVVGFPFGKQMLDVKIKETEWAVSMGVDEVDFVVDYRWVEANVSCWEINRIADLCYKKGVISKAIIETCLLSDEEIKQISELSMNAGVDFIKTSTGFGSRGATVKDIELIKSVVGDNVGIKASGGIKSYSDVEKFLKCGATRIGTSNAVSIMEECKALNKDVNC